MEMTLVNAGPEYTHIALSGRVDLKGIGDLDWEFTRHTVTRKKPVLVDISEVDFLASIGLRMLVKVAKAIAKNSAKMVLLNPHPNVEEVLRTSGFDKIISIEQDYEKALETIKNSS
jgi:anti-sigma B factor antagonist